MLALQSLSSHPHSDPPGHPCRGFRHPRFAAHRWSRPASREHATPPSSRRCPVRCRRTWNEGHDERQAETPAEAQFRGEPTTGDRASGPAAVDGTPLV